MAWPPDPFDTRHLPARIVLAAIASLLGAAWWAIGRLIR